MCDLPYRQLRNELEFSEKWVNSDLPYRQLRNTPPPIVLRHQGDLPCRQPRNVVVESERVDIRDMPYR